MVRMELNLEELMTLQSMRCCDLDGLCAGACLESVWEERRGGNCEKDRLDGSSTVILSPSAMTVLGSCDNSRIIELSLIGEGVGSFVETA